MNILILHSLSVTKAVSGEYSVFSNEAKLLKDHGHNVIAIEYGPNYIHTSLFYKFYYLIGSVFSVGAFLSVRKYIKKFNPDVIHFHGLFPFLTLSSLFAAKLYGVRVVLTLHNVGFICCEGGFFKNERYCDICMKSSLFNGVLNTCYKNKFASFIKYITNKIALDYNFLNYYVDSFIAVSEFIKETYVFKGINHEKIFIKYNHILSSKVSSFEILTEKGITFIGRLTKSKGTDTLLNVMKSFNIRINVIGDGEEREYLNQMCNTLGLKNVYFFGNIENSTVHALIRQSYCTIIPSICAESFSLVAAESFINGIPVVAYDVGGLGDLVKQSNAGKVSKLGDYNDFINNIKFYINNQEENYNAGVRGVIFAQSVLIESKSYSSLINIYNI